MVVVRVQEAPKIMDLCDDQIQTAELAVKTILELEKNPLFTQNTHYLDSCRQKWLTHYTEVRLRPWRYEIRSAGPEIEDDSPVFSSGRTVEGYPTPKDRALSALAEIGYKNLSGADLIRLAPPDRFSEELIVMADVRAYFQVSYKVSEFTSS